LINWFEKEKIFLNTFNIIIIEEILLNNEKKDIFAIEGFEKQNERLEVIH